MPEEFGCWDLKYFTEIVEGQHQFIVLLCFIDAVVEMSTHMYFALVWW